MWLVLFMPWATIGAFGSIARNSFHTDGCLPKNSAFTTMVSGTFSSLNSRPTRDNAPVDRILTERLVHEVRIARRKIWAEDRALAEAELLDEEREADCDLFAGRPGGGVDRFALETRDAVNSILRQGC